MHQSGAGALHRRGSQVAEEPAACCRGTRRCKGLRGGFGDDQARPRSRRRPISRALLSSQTKPARPRLPEITLDYYSLPSESRLPEQRPSRHRRPPPKEPCALPSSSDGPAPCRSPQSPPPPSGYRPRTVGRSQKASTRRHRRQWTASSTRSNAAQPAYSAKASRPHLGQQATRPERLTATPPSIGCHPICASTSSFPDAKSTRASKPHIATWSVTALAPSVPLGLVC